MKHNRLMLMLALALAPALARAETDGGAVASMADGRPTTPVTEPPPPKDVAPLV